MLFHLWVSAGRNGTASAFGSVKTVGGQADDHTSIGVRRMIRSDCVQKKMM